MDVLLAPEAQRRLAIVIPAYNEEGGISATLAMLRKHLPEAEVIVIDDGSSDRTGAIAQAIAGVRVLRQPFNRGYGAGGNRRDPHRHFLPLLPMALQDVVDAAEMGEHANGGLAVVAERFDDAVVLNAV